jgi:3-oxoacyl-[acyl-carrier-protein] synthase III
MPKYDVKVQLSGNDGNAFSVMGAVKQALKKAGASKEEIDQYITDSMSGDYDNLLRVAMDWVKVK